MGGEFAASDEALTKAVQDQVSKHPELFTATDNSIVGLFAVTDEHKKLQRLFVSPDATLFFVKPKENAAIETLIDRTLNLDTEKNPLQTVRYLANPIDIATPTIPGDDLDSRLKSRGKHLERVGEEIINRINSGELDKRRQIVKPNAAIHKAFEQFNALVVRKDDSPSIVAVAQLAVDRFGLPAVKKSDDTIETPTIPGSGQSKGRQSSV